MSEQTKLPEQTKPTIAMARPRILINDLLLAASTVVAAVVVAGAITELKLPPYVGD